MMTSKFVGYFLEQVSDWQHKLSTADSVITIWFEVQRTWSHLESIFIGSEDIRSQLPEHSKQFDSIDADFKVWQAAVEIEIIINNYNCAWTGFHLVNLSGGGEARLSGGEAFLPPPPPPPPPPTQSTF